MKEQLTKFALAATITLALTFTFGCSDLPDLGDTPSNGLIGSGTFVDKRDNKSYKFVKVNTQIWMAENLNYNANGSFCYEKQNSNCETYGRLYSWETAMEACPPDWRLPSAEEWEILLKFLDPNCGQYSEPFCPKAGNKLKDTKGWKDYGGDNGNGTNIIGFSALPGGMGGAPDESSAGLGEAGFWWGSSQDDNGNGYVVMASNRDTGVFYEYNNKSYLFLFSVRCLKN